MAAFAREPGPYRFRWPQWQLLALLLVVGAIYFARLGDLSLRGEETRRARVAMEMLESGDWVVPREQGRLFPDRPPLGNWLIALSMLATGSVGTIAVRLPTVLATLTTSVIVYRYSRRFLSANAALVAGLAYATLAQVMSLGMLAETEATFTLFVGASLLAWHAAYRRGWPAWRTWCLGYALVALAALTKGLQGPVYFAAATTLYLCYRRDWRFWASGGHAVGLTVGAGLVAAWQVPYAREVAWPLVLQTWGHTSAARFDYSSLWAVAGHLVSFPIEIAACLLPWSVWLLEYRHRDFRRSLHEEEREAALFLAIAIAAAFPTCWLAPQARSRYFMPLYPCVAPLVGIVIEHAWSGAALAVTQALWRRYMSCAAAAAATAGLAVASASFLPWLKATPLNQSPTFALAYLALCLPIAAVLWRARLPLARSVGENSAVGRPSRPSWATGGPVALTAFIGLTFNGVLMNDAIRRSDDIAAQVAAVKQHLPRGTELVSFGRAHHPFVYYYGQTIAWLDWPKSPLADRHEYFCFHSVRGRRKPLPFDWEQIAVVRCDRYLRDQPVDAMIVGRRTDLTGQAHKPGSQAISR